MPRPKPKTTSVLQGLIPQPIKPNIQIKTKPAALEIKIKPLIKNVGPGSYVPIEVEIINDNNFYFPVTLTFLKAP